MSTKRIVIDARILRTSTGRYIERLLHYLQKIDHTNEYIVLLNKKDFAGWEPTASNFRKVEADYASFSPSALLKLGKFIKTLKPDLVHFAFQSIPPNYNGKQITTIHDLTQLRFKNKGAVKTNLVYSVKQKQLALLFRFTIRKSAFIIVPTQYVKNDLLRFSSKKYDKKVVVTLEGADTTLGTHTRDISDIAEKYRGSEYILYVGTAHAHKNLAGVIKSFKILQEQHPKLKLLLAGKQDLVYKNFIESLSKSELKNIDILGFVSDEDLVWLYKHARAYVFASFSEGFGLPGLEAMQFDCPVVSSNATCLPEVYGNAAHYFNPSDKQDMARAINEVLSDESLRKKLIEEGRKQVKKFSWEKMARETLEVYKKALEQ